MTRDEAVAMLKRSVEEWNEYRKQNPGFKPDLKNVDLSGLDLRRVNLRWADLREAYLRGADLQGADLRGADLQGAVICDANFDGTIIRFRGKEVEIIFKEKNGNQE